LIFWVFEGSFISSLSYFVYNHLSLVDKSRRTVAFIEITVEVGVAKWSCTEFITDEFILDGSKFSFYVSLKFTISSFKIIPSTFTGVR